MNPTKISSLARPLDVEYPSNRWIIWIIAGSFVIGTGFHLISNHSFLRSLLEGLSMAITAFLAWALTREIDPDYTFSAILASVGSFLAHFWFESPHFLALFLILMLLRVTGRPVGPAAKWTDTILVSAAAIYLAITGSWVIGLFAAVFLLLDYRLPDGIVRHLIFSSLILAATITGILIHQESYYPGEFYWISVITVLLISIFSIVAIRKYGTPVSTADFSKITLNPLRIRSIQLTGTILLIVLYAYYGFPSLAKYYPFWITYAMFSLNLLLIPPGWRKKP